MRTAPALLSRLPHSVARAFAGAHDALLCRFDSYPLLVPMAPWNDGLVGVHYEIAADVSSPLHVLAGPGTGKTFAMMRRVARLLEEGVEPEKILALSFTRTAATDLRAQLLKLGAPGVARVRASTLHSLCFSLLSQAAAFPLTNRKPRSLLSYEVKYLELDLADTFGGLKPVRRLREAYEAAWARLQTDMPGGPSKSIDAAYHAAVLQWLTYHGAMLIGELIPLTLAFAEQNPASDLIPAFTHVLVDEYQDLNKAEQALVERLARDGSLTIIGDDCQSIYSFRHANPEGIREFPATHPGTVVKTILESHRCPPNIVAMSNSLIENEPARTRPVPLTPDPVRQHASVVVVQHRTLEDEINAVADFAHDYLRRNEALHPGQVLVLTPRRFIGNRIRDALIARGRNAMSYFTEDPVQPDAAGRGMALLTLLVDPFDRPALRAWLGMGSTTGLRRGYRRVVAAAQAAAVEPSEILRRLAAGEVTLPHTAPLVGRWEELTAVRAAIAGVNGLDLVRALWPQDDETCDDIRLVAETVAINAPEPAVILEEVRQAITQPSLPDSDSDIIRVMSLHKSKGLTASLVVIAGAMAGALPTIEPSLPQAEQDAQRLEQRRLFYVAITRATDTLVVSAPARIPFSEAMRAQVTVVQQQWSGGEKYSVVAMTPFLGELGAARPATITGDSWRTDGGF